MTGTPHEDKPRREKIEALRALKYNWNSYGAEPFHPNTIEAALLLEPFLPACFDSVVPVATGGIMFGINADDVTVEVYGWDEADMEPLRAARSSCAPAWTPKEAKRLLDFQHAHCTDDYAEAYHQIYWLVSDRAADIYHPWAEVEDAAKSAVPECATPNVPGRPPAGASSEPDPDLTAAARSSSATCKWDQDDDGVYHTGCGNAWFFDTGTAEDNKAKFCPYCGGGITRSAIAPAQEKP